MVKIFFLLFISFINLHPENTVTDYKTTFEPGYNQKADLIVAIRTFYQDNKLHYLVVNPFDFSTQVIEANFFKNSKKNHAINIIILSGNHTSFYIIFVKVTDA